MVAKAVDETLVGAVVVVVVAVDEADEAVA